MLPYEEPHGAERALRANAMVGPVPAGPSGRCGGPDSPSPVIPGVIAERAPNVSA